MTLDERLAAVWREAARIGVGVVRGDPITATIIIGATTAVMAAGMAAVQSQASAAAASSQSKAAQYNATIQRQQGQQAMEVATSKEAGSIRSGNAALGQTAAGIAQSGIGIQSGSAQDVLRQNEVNAQLDQLNINYEGQLQKRGYNDNALQYDFESQAQKANANNAMTQGYLGAGAALVQGAGSTYSGVQNVSLIKQGIMPPGYYGGGAYGGYGGMGGYGGGPGGIY